MEDALSFLDGETPAEPAATPTSDATAPTDTQPRGPDGKFASKEGDTPATPPAAPQEPAQAAAAQPAAEQPPAAPAQPNTPPDGFAPLGVVNELRQKIRTLEQAQQGPPPQAPDPFEDPDGYEAFQDSRVASARFGWSMKYAVKEHGEETVNAAIQWASREADLNQAFAQQSFNHDDPVGFAIEQYQRDQAIKFFADPKNLESFRAFQAAQTGALTPQAVPAATPAPPQPAAPPSPSLAAAPNAGGTPPGAAPVYKGAAFDSTF